LGVGLHIFARYDSMIPADTKKLEHLKWAVESRDRNQRCAVRLLGLFMEYEQQWKTKHWARAAQELLSVSFSLWRAAFLADKTATRSAVFSHATEFLQKLIEDNAISYLQDRKCKEWTFNYYTRNARAALETLHKHWPEQVSMYEGRNLTPTKRWEYCQELLDKAVERFEVAAREIRTRKSAARQVRERRLVKKAQRKKVRAMTLASRSGTRSH
jgi:hypothetical protein